MQCLTATNSEGHRESVRIMVVGEEAMAFNVDESTALLHVMYPNYPDMRNSLRCPSDLQKWLQVCRATAVESEANESSRSS